jgi:hypothetical protein
MFPENSLKLYFIMKTLQFNVLPDKKVNFFIEDVDGQDTEAIEVLD